MFVGYFESKADRDTKSNVFVRNEQLNETANCKTREAPAVTLNNDLITNM